MQPAHEVESLLAVGAALFKVEVHEGCVHGLCARDLDGLRGCCGADGSQPVRLQEEADGFDDVVLVISHEDPQACGAWLKAGCE